MLIEWICYNTERFSTEKKLKMLIEWICYNTERFSTEKKLKMLIEWICYNTERFGTEKKLKMLIEWICYNTERFSTEKKLKILISVSANRAHCIVLKTESPETFMATTLSASEIFIFFFSKCSQALSFTFRAALTWYGERPMVYLSA